MPAIRNRPLLLTLVFLSGAAGLVYQVVWHRYLTILLGAQARATVAVLAIFLGGISAGYLFFGRWTRSRQWNLLAVYAVVELALCAWALLFPSLFQGSVPLTSKLYSLLGVQNIAIDVFVSCLLIGFPTFLMGGTLPLLTQGISESLEEASGAHARIYGFNTVGACCGSLIAGYVLIPMLGLAGSCRLAGLVNGFIGIASYFLFARSHHSNQSDSAPVTSATGHVLSVHSVILYAIGFCSGFYILCLETVLIRIVGLSTGSSDSNFTLIVSIFVFGLGFGSLLARRISRYTTAHLFWNQLAVSFSLVLVYLSADHWPYWSHLVRILFRDQVENYYVYQAALGVMFLAVLVVPVSACGLVLPLCFHLLKDRKETLGHRVGQLYGLNTVGSVLGAIIGGYYLLYFLNLDHLFRVCIGITLVMLALSAYSYFKLQKPSRLIFGSGLGFGASILVALFLLPAHAKENYLQPFRQQMPIEPSYKGWRAFRDYLGSASHIIFHKDGPNSSIIVGTQSLVGIEVSRTIFVNGKSDGNTKGDFHTMSLTGHIPALLARKLDRVAVIGFGTGITAGSLLSYADLGSLDIIEISETLIKNAHYFDEYNGGVSTSNRVQFQPMDAFRYFGGTESKYDLVISEPSNPWVSGVENLYAGEFYDIACRKLNPGGLYVQWLQGYAFRDDLVRKVLKTLSSRFNYVAAFQMMSSDFALVASDKAIDVEDLKRSAERFSRNVRAQAGLKKSGILNFETVLALELVPSELIRAVTLGVDALELAKPVLSHEAAKGFFVRDSVEMDQLRRYFKEFFALGDKFLLRKYLSNNPIPADVSDSFRHTFCADPVGQNQRLCIETFLMRQISGGGRSPASFPLVVPDSEREGLDGLLRPQTLTGNFTRENLHDVGRQFGIFKKYFSPLAAFKYEPLIEKLDYGLARISKEEGLFGECLLQKTAILEIVDSRDETLKPVIDQYNEWFAARSPQSPDYERFKEAKSVLDRLVIARKAQTP